MSASQCGIHTVHVHVHVDSNMHPVHDKEETSLNVRGSWDSQNLRGQDILKISNCTNKNKRKSEQAHIPHAQTLFENAVYNEWQFHALGTGNRTKKGDINW